MSKIAMSSLFDKSEEVRIEIKTMEEMIELCATMFAHRHNTVVAWFMKDHTPLLFNTIHMLIAKAAGFDFTQEEYALSAKRHRHAAALTVAQALQHAHRIGGIHKRRNFEPDAFFLSKRLRIGLCFACHG